MMAFKTLSLLFVALLFYFVTTTTAFSPLYHPSSPISTAQIFSILADDENFPPVLHGDPQNKAGQSFSNPARLRQKMIESKWDCPGGICDAGLAFIQSFPRIRGNSSFPHLDIQDSSTFTSPETIDYGIGAIAFSVGLPLVLLIIFVLGWLFFCCGRGCCNCLGGRVATKKFSTLSTWLVRGLLILWATCVILILFLCIASNHGISKGLSKSVDGVDNAFVFFEDTSTILRTATQPFSSRIAVIQEVADAMSQLPSNNNNVDCFSAASPDPSVYPNGLIMKSHVDTFTDIITTTTNSQNVVGFTQLTSISSRLQESFDNMGLTPDQPADTTLWNKDGATTRTIFDSSLIWQNLPESNALFTATSNAYASISNITTLAQNANDQSTKEVEVLKAIGSMISSITKPVFNDDYGAILAAYQRGTVSPSECNTLVPQLTSLIDSLVQVINTNSASSVGVLAELTLSSSTITNSSVPVQISFILDQIIRIEQQLYPNINTEWSKFRQHSIIDRFYDLNDNSLLIPAIEATTQRFSAINAILTGLQGGISDTGGSATAQQNFDVSTVKALYTSTTTNLNIAGSTSAKWLNLADTISTTPFTRDCIADLTHVFMIAEEWFAPPPDDLLFVADHNTMIQALKYDQTIPTGQAAAPNHAAEVRANIIANLQSVSTGLAQSLNAAQHITNTANALSLNYPYSTTNNPQTELGQLQTALSDIVTSFESIEFQSILAYDDIYNSDNNASYMTLFGDIKTSFTSLKKAYDELTQVSTRYQLSTTTILGVIRSQLVIYLTTTKNLLGTCSVGVSLADNNDIPIPAITTLLTNLSQLRGKLGRTQVDINTEVQSYTEASTAVSGFISKELPVLQRLRSALRPFNAVSYDDRAVSTINYSSPGINPTGESRVPSFYSTLFALQSQTNTINTLLASHITKAVNTMTFVRSGTTLTSFSQHTAALMAISTSSTNPNDSSHFVPNFPYNPFWSKPTPWKLTDNSVQPPAYGTAESIIGYLNIMKDRVRGPYYDDVLSTIGSIKSRVEDIETSFSKVDGYISDWADVRTDVKRSGFVIDQERIILLDVYLSIGIVIVFCIAALALFKCHKATMLCSTLLCPFIILSLLLAAIHFAPGLIISDACNDRETLVISLAGDSNVPASATKGLVSYISKEAPEPIAVIDLYHYSAKCNQTAIPQVIRVLRDARPDTVDIKQDDLTSMTDELRTELAAYGLTIAPHLDEIVTDLELISTDLAAKANQLFDTIKCDKTEVVFQQTLDDGMCGTLVKSAAILGALLVLCSICILPGLILGCRAFKRLNKRNHVDYKRKYNTHQTADGETYVYAAGFVEKDGEEKTSEIIHYKVNSPELQDGTDYGNLKGFEPNREQKQQLEMSRY